MHFQFALLITMRMGKNNFFSFFFLIPILILPFSSCSFSSYFPVPPTFIFSSLSSSTHFTVQALKIASTSHTNFFFPKCFVHSVYSRSSFVILSCYPNIALNLYLSVILYTNPFFICFHILSLEIYSRLEQ